MSIGLGLIYAATGALKGFEEKDEREREREERERSNRLRELQEMQYLTSLLNTPGVMAGGDTRAGMQQLGPAPEGLGTVADQFMPQGLMDMAWNAARGAGAAAGPERDIMPLGEAGGQQIGWDPYMSAGAQAERAAQGAEYKTLLEEAESELTNYEAYQELQRRGVRVGNYNEAVDYPQIVQRNVESGITEERTWRGAEHTDTLVRGRTDETRGESERVRKMKLDVRNRAFTLFHGDESATVSQFQETMTEDEKANVDLPSLQTIWREAHKVEPDPGPKELRQGLYNTLGKPGSRTWTPPDSTKAIVLDPSWHKTVLDFLTEPYKGLGRPLTTEEILKNYTGAFEAGDLTEFELKTIEEVLRPLEDQGNTITIQRDDGSVFTFTMPS